MDLIARSLLVRHADVVVTMDDARSEPRDASVFVVDGVVEAVGPDADVTAAIASAHPGLAPAKTIDARGCVVLPGLVNGHHHLFQSLTRAIGTGGGLALFDWLKRLYPLWATLDPDAVHVSAKLALAELMRSGATTVADHLYLFPNGARLDDTIAAAVELGVRFHPTRGSMSIGESHGGLPPDRLVEDERAILADCRRVIEAFHDPSPRAMVRVGLAPCSPFSVSADLMRETASMARAHRAVGLHTHLAETLDEDRWCERHVAMRPVDYAESLGWLGPDVWFAHMVHPSPADVGKLGRSGSGVCHCATSNMILASGIAPVRAMIDAGVRVGLGVDGSASNDGNHLLAEARQAMLLQRVGWPGFESRADRLSAREALFLATRGGASMLGRDDIGRLEPGFAADLVAFRVDGIEHAGAAADPVAALLTCSPGHAWLSVIDGRVVVEDGALVGVDPAPLVERHDRIARRMLADAGLA